MLNEILSVLFEDGLEGISVIDLHPEKTTYYDLHNGTVYRVKLEANNVVNLLKRMSDVDGSYTKWSIYAEWNKETFSKIIELLNQ